MPAIATKLVIESASHLGILIDAHARDIGRQLGDWLRSQLRDDETLPDFTLVLELPARRIRQIRQYLCECHNELDEAQSKEYEARFWRDQTASALRRKLVQVRRLLTSVLGSQRTAKLLGIKGRTAHDSQHPLLLSQADAFLKLLRDPQRLAIKPALHYFDPAAVAADIAPHADACRQACGQLDEMCEASAYRRAARNSAQTELECAVQSLASVLSGFLLLTGRTDLAKKLYPIQHPGKGPRPGRSS